MACRVDIIMSEEAFLCTRTLCVCAPAGAEGKVSGRGGREGEEHPPRLSAPPLARPLGGPHAASPGSIPSWSETSKWWQNSERACVSQAQNDLKRTISHSSGAETFPGIGIGPGTLPGMCHVLGPGTCQCPSPYPGPWPGQGGMPLADPQAWGTSRGQIGNK